MHQLFRYLLIILGIVLTLTACSQQAFFDKIVPQEENTFAQEMFTQLSQKNYVAVEKYLSPELQDESTRTTLIKMAALFPRETVKEVNLIHAQKTLFKDDVTYHLIFEYEYSDQWLINKISLRQHDNTISIIGMHTEPVDRALSKVNAFTFKDKGFIHYLTFILAIFIPLFIIYVFILCIRTPMQKRKWLWLLFISLGFIKFSLNWTSGSYAIQPMSFLLLGAGYFQDNLYSPIILQISLPLGAILFLYRRRSLTTKD